MKARQLGDAGEGRVVPRVNGADAAFLRHTTYGSPPAHAATARRSAVWHALREHRNLAVVDQFAVPAEGELGHAAPPNLLLTGFYLEDKTFDPSR